MSSWLHDIYVGARILLARPAFTLVAVLTLALGIGATTAIFSVVDTVLLKNLPYGQPDRLVRVFSTTGKQVDDRASASFPDYVDWAQQAKTLESFAGFVRWSFNLSEDGPAQRVWGGQVTSTLFPAMGVRPLLGRGFLPEEDRPGGAKVAVLSEELWHSAFGGVPDILGRKLRLDGVEYVVVGVMPRGFDFPSDARIWVPLAMAPKAAPPRSVHFLRVVARLAPGATLGSARSEMSAIARRLEELYPDTNSDRGARLVPLHEYLVGSVRPALIALLAAAGLVLLIACGNLANLLLSRFTERQGELALRRALGASRRGLFGQFFLESLLLATAGGAGGLLLAWLGVRTLVALNLDQQHASVFADRLHDIPRLEQVGVDARVLAFALLITLATALAVSLFPAGQLSEAELSRTLNEGGRGALGTAGGRRLRSVFVVVEVALALSMVIGATLLIRSFVTLASRDPGFRTEKVITLQLSLPAREYVKAAQTTAFYDELLGRIERLPGVVSAGLTWGLPLSGTFGTADLDLEGHPRDEHTKYEASVQPASPHYFQTLGIPLLHGRLFGPQDTASSPPAVIVNSTLARRFFPGENAVGKHVTLEAAFGPVGSLSGKREIVGVVADTRNMDLGKEAAAEIYFPYPQGTWRMVSVAVRAAGDPGALAPALRQQVWAIDRELSIANLQPMEQVVSQSVAQPRFNMALLVVFAALAVVLAGVGIYGIISYSVNLRVREIGIRMALGARRQDVARQVMREGAVLTVLGLCIGTAAALGLTRLLSSLLFGVSPADPLTFAAAVLFLLLVAQLASYLPARRATRVEPLIALRNE